MVAIAVRCVGKERHRHSCSYRSRYVGSLRLSTRALPEGISTALLRNQRLTAGFLRPPSSEARALLN